MEKNSSHISITENLENIIKDLPAIVKMKIRLADIFNSIHQKLNRGYYSQDLLNDIYSSLQLVIPFDRLGIALIEDEGRSIRLSWVRSDNNLSLLNIGYSAVLKGSSLHQIIRTGKPRIINDLQAYYELHPESESTKLALEEGIRSNLTLPLITENRPIGVIFFSSSTPYAFQNFHIDIFTEISEGLSLIIKHGQLKQTVEDIEAKENIFRNTIHDLNNPLSVIKGTLDLAFKKEWFQNLGIESKNSMAVLKRSCDSMIHLVQELINVKTVSEVEKSLHLDSNSIEDFLSEVIIDGQIMAEKKNIQISLSKNINVPKIVYFDFYKLKDAILNLVSNAIKFSTMNTHVSINVDVIDNDSKLCFSIKDQGQGIPENELSHLFKDFGITSTRPTDGESSTGLGLSNVKRIADIHHGEVKVQSKIGIGSTFSFSIPIKTL